MVIWMNADDKGLDNLSPPDESTSDSIEVIETVAACSVSTGANVKRNSNKVSDSILEMAMSSSVRKMSIDKYQDRNQRGDTPADFGEHLPIDELAVTYEVVGTSGSKVVPIK